VFDSIDKSGKGIITPLDLSAMMGIQQEDAEALMNSTPRSVRSARRGEGIDFHGFVRLLRDQEGKEKARLENIVGPDSDHSDSDHSDHSNSDNDSNDDGSDSQSDAAFAGKKEVFENLLEQSSKGDASCVSVAAVVGWAEEVVKKKLTPAEALKFQFSFHERMAEAGSAMSFDTFADIMDDFPELFEQNKSK